MGVLGCLLGASTHGLLSSSFLGLPYRILANNPKKEILRGLWVVWFHPRFRTFGSTVRRKANAVAALSTGNNDSYTPVRAMRVYRASIRLL